MIQWGLFVQAVLVKAVEIMKGQLTICQMM